MIYNLLSKLFKQDIYDRYTPKPQHVFVILLWVGASVKISVLEGYEAFGVISAIVLTFLSVVISLGIGWDKSIEYWDKMNEHIKLMMKVKDPDIWQALGYKHPPQSVQIIETQDNGQGFFSTKINKVDISPAIMNQVANKVIGTGNMEFTESTYGSLIPNFRQFRKDWVSQGKLVQKNKKNKRNGYVLSRKGMQVIYEYASESVKELKNNES